MKQHYKKMESLVRLIPDEDFMRDGRNAKIFHRDILKNYTLMVFCDHIKKKINPNHKEEKIDVEFILEYLDYSGAYDGLIANFPKIGIIDSTGLTIVNEKNNHGFTLITNTPYIGLDNILCGKVKIYRNPEQGVDLLFKYEHLYDLIINGYKKKGITDPETFIKLKKSMSYSAYKYITHSACFYALDNDIEIPKVKKHLPPNRNIQYLIGNKLQ